MEEKDFLEELVRESMELSKPKQLNRHPITILVEPEMTQQDIPTHILNNFNQFEGLAVPMHYNRPRSGSLASSIGSANFDTITEYSDWDDTFGEVLPFNGSTVVQIPSPWIRQIGSPSGSNRSRSGSISVRHDEAADDIKQVSHIDFADFFQNQQNLNQYSDYPASNAGSTSIYQHPLPPSPNPYAQQSSIYQHAPSPLPMSLSPNPYSDSFYLQSPNITTNLNQTSLLSPGIYSPNLQSPKPFYQQSHNSNSGSNIYQHSANSTQPENLMYQSNLQPNTLLNQLDSSDLFGDNSQSLQELDKLTIPDGKFWKVFKDNGQTLYQCPWPQCEKSTILINVAFTRPYNLKSHYRGHIGEKPYDCKELDCDAAFSRKHDLKRHLKLHSYWFINIGARKNTFVKLVVRPFREMMLWEDI
jgi:hypothetical protein